MEDPRHRRLARRAVLLIVPAAVLLPALTGDDSFPLSNYPMYAFQRDRTERFPSVLAQDSSGRLEPVSSRVLAGTDDPLLAEAVITSAIAAGMAGDLCQTVAAQAAPDATRILVVVETHDVIAAARRRPSLLDREVHASCVVAR